MSWIKWDAVGVHNDYRDFYAVKCFVDLSLFTFCRQTRLTGQHFKVNLHTKK